MTVQFSAQILGVQSKVDRTLNVRLNTQELSKDEAGLLYDYSGKQVWCAIAETPLREDELNIPEAVSEFKNDKSPSQRLRSILYVYWDKNQKGKEEWDAFYKRQMNKLCEYIKGKLD